MIEDLPDPLVGAGVDLRDFGYMPLDVVRLRDSDLAILARPEVFRASVMLWCAAWHQVPAGSLPSNDRLLADYSRAGPRWRAIREEVLADFILCSDGRLYHPTVVEKVHEAIGARAAQKARTVAATAAREAKRKADEAAKGLKVAVAIERSERDEGPAQLRLVPLETERDVQRDVERNVQRDVERNVVQGKGREGKGRELKEKETWGAVAPRLAGFPEFWQAWPKSRRKDRKGLCEALWRDKRLAEQTETILRHVRFMAASPEWQRTADDGGDFIPAPQVYLRQRRWEGAEIDGLPSGGAEDWEAINARRREEDRLADEAEARGEVIR